MSTAAPVALLGRNGLEINDPAKAAVRSINSSGVRVISSTFAPRLLWGLLTGSLAGT